MTMHEDSAFSDAGRLRDALEEEVDRPGLEGPSLEAVLRSAAGRVRRRRVTVGATFAVAAVAVGTSVAVSHGLGTSGQEPGLANAATGTSIAAAGTTAATTAAAAAGTTTAPSQNTTTPSSQTTTIQLPADLVLKSGTLDGHPWRLSVHFLQPTPPPSPLPGEPSYTDPSHRNCAEIAVFMDDTWTNAGGGGEDCVVDGQQQHYTPPLDQPGFSSIGILDPEHGYHGGVVVGNVNSGTASVVAQCSSGKKYETTPFQPVAGGSYYYTFLFPNGSGCGAGTLSFYDASHKRVAYLGDVALGSTK